MVASVGASFAFQRGLRCCTKPQAVFGFCSFLSGFYLQIAAKRKSTRRDSNSWPPPCEGGEKFCRGFQARAKCWKSPAFCDRRVSRHFRRFTWVAVRLLHGQCETSEGRVGVSTKFPDAGVVPEIAFRVALVPEPCPLTKCRISRSLDLESTSVFAKEAFRSTDYDANSRRVTGISYS